MNLSRKLDIAKASITSITRHDDASEREITACGALLQELIKDELAAAGARRQEKERKAIEALARQA